MKRKPHDHAFGHAKHGQHGLWGHQWLHGNRNEHQQVAEPDLNLSLKGRAIGAMVTATIDGEAVSWTNEYAGPGAVTPVAGAGDVNDSAPEKAEAGTEVGSGSIALAASTPTTNIDSANKASLSTQDTSNAGNGGTAENKAGTSWARQAYFNAEAATVEGITFLNHFGGMNGIPGTTAGGPAFVKRFNQSRRGEVC